MEKGKETIQRRDYKEKELYRGDYMEKRLYEKDTI